MTSAHRLTPRDRDRAIERLRSITTGIAFVSVSATVGFGVVAALTDASAAAASGTTAAASTSTSTASTSQTTGTTTGTLGSSSSLGVSSGGTRHATTGGS